MSRNKQPARCFASSRDYSLAVVFCGFIPHLIGREAINIPDTFSGVHGLRERLGPGGTRANFVYFQFLANFGCRRIGRTCFNQNFTDRHVRHKIYRVNSSQIFPYAACSCPSALQQRVIFRHFFARLAGVCVAFTTCDRRKIVASNQIKETSHRI